MTAIAAGHYHSLALTEEGTVVGWGLNGSRGDDVPPEVQGNVTAIAAGELHSLALTEGGTVTGWGNNNYG